jgi:hypothetical protein
MAAAFKNTLSLFAGAETSLSEVFKSLDLVIKFLFNALA